MMSDDVESVCLVKEFCELEEHPLATDELPS